MTGWLIIFAGTAMTSGFWGSLSEHPAALPASALFGLLFVLALSTKAVRGESC